MDSDLQIHQPKAKRTLLQPTWVVVHVVEERTYLVVPHSLIPSSDQFADLLNHSVADDLIHVKLRHHHMVQVNINEEHVLVILLSLWVHLLDYILFKHLLTNLRHLIFCPLLLHKPLQFRFVCPLFSNISRLTDLNQILNYGRAPMNNKVIFHQSLH